MSFSKKEAFTDDAKISNANKATKLNPNAAEFIPFALRSSSSGTTNSSNAAAALSSSPSLGKTVLDRTESSVSNASDDEVHQYWRHQLPDDITPDFKVVREEVNQSLGNLSLMGLSLHDEGETSVFFSSTGGDYLLNEPHINGNNFSKKLRAGSTYGEDLSSASFLHMPTKSWEEQILGTSQLASNVQEGHSYDEASKHGFMNGMLGEHAIADDINMNTLEFLASQFPGFAAEILARVYFANGCDLNLTIEVLTHLELQVDGDFNQNLSTKTLSAPNLSAMDFPALTETDVQIGHSNYAGDEIQQEGNPYRSSDKESLLLFRSSSSIPSRGGTDYASTVRKLVAQDPGVGKYEKNSVADATIGSSRSTNFLTGSYNSGHERGVYGDKLQYRGPSDIAPAWLETGDAVANLYSELREEARDHARLCNAYFEQAQQAYLVGNKALAKELSLQGQLHNVHMKTAHGKAEESIYRRRNPVAREMQGNGRAQERMIDLHGLHVSEAIHVLKHELTALRSTARVAEQCLQVYICVGTGHHTRGSRTTARLPVAVQRCLVEEEGLEYNEPQPGLLRVMIY